MTGLEWESAIAPRTSPSWSRSRPLRFLPPYGWVYPARRERLWPSSARGSHDKDHEAWPKVHHSQPGGRRSGQRLAPKSSLYRGRHARRPSSLSSCLDQRRPADVGFRANAGRRGFEKGAAIGVVVLGGRRQLPAVRAYRRDHASAVGSQVEFVREAVLKSPFAAR